MPQKKGVAEIAAVRSLEEIQADIAHLEYGKAILDERLGALKEERARLREDAFPKRAVTKRLAAFFRAQGFFIVGHSNGQRTKDHYALAKQVWRTPDVLLPFIKTFSRNMKAPFVYGTASLTPAQKTDLRNLCEMLVRKEWLTYTIGADGFEVKPALNGTQKCFLRGGWAEEINIYLIDKTLKSFTKDRHLGHKLFWDVRLSRVDTDRTHGYDMQLDLVAEVGQRFYIFETKSGFILSIAKWVDRARLFENEKGRFITCAADGNLNPLIFDPFRLFALPTLEQQFGELLLEDFPVALSNP